MGKLGSIKDIYSDDTWKTKESLSQIEANKPGDYQSQYTDKINNALNDILNQKKFSYDFNADPLYQQYKDQYTQLGNQAMQNTVANAAALTGGYGNSYGVTAGAQANQAYLQQLNNVIPELYNAALQKYDMDRQDLYNKYSALGAQEDREYGKYRDSIADWQTDRGYYNDKYAGAVANDQYVADYNQAEQQYQQEYEKWLEEMKYQKERDTVADSQWQQMFDYQRQQDALAYAASQAVSGGYSGGSSSGGSSGGSAGGSKKSGMSETYNSVKNEAASIQQKEGLTKSQDYLVSKVNEGVITSNQAETIYFKNNNNNKKNNTKKNANAQIK